MALKSAGRPLLATVGVVLATAAILFLLGRPLICTCGSIAWWGPVGPKQSQMLFDWYSASHLIHGFLFYAVLHLVVRKVRWERRLLFATMVEAAWELVENSPVIINRYREATIALGYSGDSVLNSVSDIVLMIVGFLLARRLPLWASLAIVVVLEVVPLIVIRDNLTLNVLMLVAPSDAVRHWQAGA